MGSSSNGTSSQRPMPSHCDDTPGAAKTATLTTLSQASPRIVGTPAVLPYMDRLPGQLPHSCLTLLPERQIVLVGQQDRQHGVQGWWPSALQSQGPQLLWELAVPITQPRTGSQGCKGAATRVQCRTVRAVVPGAGFAQCRQRLADVYNTASQPPAVTHTQRHPSCWASEPLFCPPPLPLGTTA